VARYFFRVGQLAGFDRVIARKVLSKSQPQSGRKGGQQSLERKPDPTVWQASNPPRLQPAPAPLPPLSHSGSIDLGIDVRRVGKLDS